MSAALDSVPATQSSAKEVNVAAWVDEEVRFCGEKRAVGEKGNGRAAAVPAFRSR